MAHHRGQDEQSIFPFILINAVSLSVEDTSVISIHERVGTALQLIENPRISFKIIGAGATATDDIAA